MRIRIEGHQPLRGTYRVSGNSNSAMALIAAAMLGNAPVTLTNVPDSASVNVMLEVGSSLGMSIKRSDGKVVLSADPLGARGLAREHTDALSGTLLFVAPILARRHHARMVIDYAISRLHPHLTALRDLGVKINISGNSGGGVIDLEAAPWNRREIVLTQTSVTATSLVCMLSAVLGEQTGIAHPAAEPAVVELLNLLVAMGAKVEGAGSNLLTISGRDQLSGATYTVSPDHVEAASAAAIAALTGGRLTIQGTR